MSDNVLETIRATVQDFLAPEMRTEIQPLGARIDARCLVIESLLRDLIQHFTIEPSLLERVASLEARMPKQ